MARRRVLFGLSGFHLSASPAFLSEFRRGPAEELLTHFAVQGSPGPTRSLNTEKESDFAPTVLLSRHSMVCTDLSPCKHVPLVQAAPDG